MIYRQEKAKRIPHYQISFITNTKGTSLSGKEKTKMRNMKIMNRKAHHKRQTQSKGSKSAPHNMIPNQSLRNKMNTNRILQMHLKLKDQQLKKHTNLVYI